MLEVVVEEEEEEELLLRRGQAVREVELGVAAVVGCPGIEVRAGRSRLVVGCSC